MKIKIRIMNKKHKNSLIKWKINIINKNVKYINLERQ